MTATTCEARTWHQRCRICVRRGRTWRRARDAAARASGHVAFIFLKPTRTNAALNRADSGLYWPESAVSVVSAETAETADSGRN